MTMDAHMTTSETSFNEEEQFKIDIIAGLSLPAKELPLQYCYDQTGTELFKKIIKNSENYPTACEAEILQTYKDRLSFYLDNKNFNLIELGPEGCVNSQILIEHFSQESFPFTYNIIDSSKNYLEYIAHQLQTLFPSLKYTAIHADYLTGLKNIPAFPRQKNVVLLLDSTIGKIPNLQLPAFLKQLRRLLHADDFALIGFDLRKNVDYLLARYNESNSLYYKLHMNLLERINRELGGDFNISQFSYLANYNKDMESINHFLISKEKQTVSISSLQQSFDFEPDETIYLGSDAKYREQQILSLADENGFEVIQEFSDEKNQFIESLWKVVK
jgi:L-histidine N-alpha-methyltransferase